MEIAILRHSLSASVILGLTLLADNAKRSQYQLTTVTQLAYNSKLQVQQLGLLHIMRKNLAAAPENCDQFLSNSFNMCVNIYLMVLFNLAVGYC